MVMKIKLYSLYIDRHRKLFYGGFELYKLHCANSASYLFSPLSSVPGVPPQNVEVLTKSSTSIFVRWNPPQVEFLFGIPRGYRIRYTPLHVNGSNQMSRLKNVSYTNTSVLLVGLEEFTNYSIEAAAVTIDAGVYSDAIVNRTNPGRK